MNVLSMTMVDQIIGSAPFIYEGDFAEGILRAKAVGYTGVEMHATDPVTIEVEAVEEALAKTGLSMTALGTGRAYVNEGLSLSDVRETYRKKAMERVVQFLQVAGRLKSQVIIGCMRGNIGPGDTEQSVLETLSLSMKELDVIAGELSTNLVFEPINRYENNFLCTADGICDFIHANDLHNTKVLLDTFHMNIEEADMVETIRRCAGDISHVHIADSNRWYPGRGHIDFPALFNAFEEVGYTGAYSAECLPLPSKEEAQECWLAAMKAY